MKARQVDEVLARMTMQPTTWRSKALADAIIMAIVVFEMS